MRIILIDNYDSFTYNLLHMMEEVSDAEIVVTKNDKLELEDIDKFDAIVLSPGAGIPSEAGLLLPIIERYSDKKPILGVCLGHQAIAENFGGELINLSSVFHGVQSEIDIVKKGVIFANLGDKIKVGRYHSWVASSEDFPECLDVTAVSSEGQVMAFQHKTKPIYGVQFHPESILTPEGKQMITNFINSIEDERANK